MEVRKVEFKVDKEYPSLDGITEDYKELRALSPAYAGAKGELTAILQYVYQSILFGQTGKEEMGKKLLAIAVNEMHHLELLGTAITRLGAPPAFTACLPYPVGYYSAASVNYAKAPLEMIEADIAAEKNAIADYHIILTRISNNTLIELIERIIEDEKLHLCTFESMRKELKKG